MQTIIYVLIGVVAIGIILTIYFLWIKPNNVGTSNGTGESTPPSVSPVSSISHPSFDDIVGNINSNLETDGYNDAYKGGIDIKDKINEKKSYVKQLCNFRITDINQEINTCDNKIKSFDNLENVSVDVNKEKNNKQKFEAEIKQIEQIKKDLDDDEDLSMFASYKRGFKNGQVAKAREQW
ncbi:MAG: hypothetical protein LBN23_03465 [Paludibacter sp.]|jgi:hypothetical protein|nr:hypothetical protein [Paludibacter sp.]